MRRILVETSAPDPGPTLVGIGGMHGNEPAGVRALRALGEDVARSGLDRGAFVGLAGNLPALAAGRRLLDCDLNRIWSGRGEGGSGCEAVELAELRKVLSGIRARARGPVVLLDLHTTSASGPPFLVAGDTPANRRVADAIPLPLVLGLAEALPGTLIRDFGRTGGAALVLEAGRHDDPAAQRRADDVLRLLLAELGLLGEAGEGAPVRCRARLARDAHGLPRALRLAYRHPLAERSGFRMRPGFRSFHPVRRGDLLATDRSGDVRTPVEGRLLLPLYQTTGDDGFFVGRPVRLPSSGRTPAGTEDEKSWIQPKS